MGTLRLTLAELLEGVGSDLDWEVMSQALGAWPTLGPCPFWVEATSSGSLRLYAGRRYRF